MIHPLLTSNRRGTAYPPELVSGGNLPDAQWAALHRTEVTV